MSSSVQRKFIFLGGGSHARVLWDALAADCRRATLGYTALEKGPWDQIPYLGTDAVLTHYAPPEVSLINAVGSIDIPHQRAQIFETFKKQGFTFATIIHPSVIFSQDVKWLEGVQIMAGATLQTGCHIFENCIINTGAIIDHDARISKHCHIAPGVTLSGGVTIGSTSHIGTGATVIQNISIGHHCVVGAGSVVIGDVPDNAKVYGVPARAIPPYIDPRIHKILRTSENK